MKTILSKNKTSLGIISKTRLLIKNYNPKIYNKSNNHAPNKINRMSNPMNKYKFWIHVLSK